MTFLSRFAGFVRPRRSSAPGDLATFIGRWGAFAAQKTVLDYCGVKLGVNWQKAQEEREFAALLRDCRWRVYFATQGDIAAMVEARLRPLVPGHEPSLADTIGDMAASALAATDPPAHLRQEAAAAYAGYRARLAQRQLAPPHPPTTLPLDSGPVLLATLPIHPDLRKGESVSILGALRMHIVTADQELERRFAFPPLVQALIAVEPDR